MPHDGHDDFAMEYAPGLPQKPPAGEEVIWQSSGTVALTGNRLSIGFEAGRVRWIQLNGEGEALDAPAPINPALPLVINGHCIYCRDGADDVREQTTAAVQVKVRS